MAEVKKCRRRRGKGRKSATSKEKKLAAAPVAEKVVVEQAAHQSLQKKRVVRRRRGGVNRRGKSSKIGVIENAATLPEETEKLPVEVVQAPIVAEPARLQVLTPMITRSRSRLSVVIEEPEDVVIEEKEVEEEKEPVAEIIEKVEKRAKKRGGRGRGSSAKKNQQKALVPSPSVKRKTSNRKCCQKPRPKKIRRKNAKETPAKYMEISNGEKRHEIFKMKIVKNAIENQNTLVMKSGERVKGPIMDANHIRKIYVEIPTHSKFVKFCTQVSRLLS